MLINYIALVIILQSQLQTPSYVVDYARAQGRQIILINEKAETEVPAYLNTL